MRSNLRIISSRSDAAGKQQDAELVRMLGWLMLALTAIPALFTPIGLLTGSMFWLWWTIAQGVAGVSALALSANMYARTARPARAVYRATAEEAEFAPENYQPRVA